MSTTHFCVVPAPSSTCWWARPTIGEEASFSAPAAAPLGGTQLRLTVLPLSEARGSPKAQPPTKKSEKNKKKKQTAHPATKKKWGDFQRHQPVRRKKIIALPLLCLEMSRERKWVMPIARGMARAIWERTLLHDVVSLTLPSGKFAFLVLFFRWGARDVAWQQRHGHLWHPKGARACHLLASVGCGFRCPVFLNGGNKNF